MSWTDKELDELFKGAASDQTFDYNAAFFKDIEAQLPVNKSKKRGFYWFFGASGLLMLLIGTLLFWNDASDMNTNKMSSAPANSNPVNEKSISQVNKAEKGDSQFNTPKDVNSGIPVITTVNETKSLEFNEDEIAKSKVDDLSLYSNDVEVISTLENHDNAIEVSDLATVEAKFQEGTTPDIIAQQFNLVNRNVKKSKLFIEFNGGIGQSPIQSTDNGTSRSLSWGLNAGYIYSKNDWSLSTGLGAGENYFNNLFIKERSTIYGFGVNTFDNHYQFTSLFKLDIPVNFSYHLGSHELNAGLNTSLPLFARVSYTELKDGIENEVSKGISSPSPYFRKVIFEPTLGYRFALDPDWSIGASIKAQLNSPLNSDRIKGDRNSLPLSGQITLRKTFELR